MALKPIIDSLDRVEQQFLALYEEKDGSSSSRSRASRRIPARNRSRRHSIASAPRSALSEKLTTAESRLEGLPDFDADAYPRGVRSMITRRLPQVARR